MSIKKVILSWLPVYLWCFVMFTLSSIPTVQASKIIWWDFIIKKSAHVSEYFILFLLVSRALEKNNFSKEKYLIAFIFCLAYSLSDEYHQKFVPGRNAKLMDIGFDVSGMLLAFYILKKDVNFCHLLCSRNKKAGRKNFKKV